MFIEGVEGPRLKDEAASISKTKQTKYQDQKTTSEKRHSLKHTIITSQDWIPEYELNAAQVPCCSDFQNIFEQKRSSCYHRSKKSRVLEEVEEEHSLTDCETEDDRALTTSTPSLVPTFAAGRPRSMNLGPDWAENEFYSDLNDDNGVGVGIQTDRYISPPTSTEVVSTETIANVPFDISTVPEGVPLTLEEASIMDATTTAIDAPVPEGEPISSEGPPQTKRKRRGRRKPKKPEVRVYVTEINDNDVLLGRGGKSNHHPGNKQYRDEIKTMQQVYEKSEKDDKTVLSNTIIDSIDALGGRFLQKEKPTDIGKWYIVNRKIARRKAAQALREHSTPETRALKKLKYTVVPAKN